MIIPWCVSPHKSSYLFPIETICSIIYVDFYINTSRFFYVLQVIPSISITDIAVFFISCSPYA